MNVLRPFSSTYRLYKKQKQKIESNQNKERIEKKNEKEKMFIEKIFD